MVTGEMSFDIFYHNSLSEESNGTRRHNLLLCVCLDASLESTFWLTYNLVEDVNYTASYYLLL